MDFISSLILIIIVFLSTFHQLIRKKLIIINLKKQRFDIDILKQREREREREEIYIYIILGNHTKKNEIIKQDNYFNCNVDILKQKGIFKDFVAF